MREIKFRVWDIYKKVFIPINVYAITSAKGGFGVMLNDWEDYREGEVFFDSMQILNQFTGLKDKNGKEIYEGDVIFERGQNREVIFHKGCFCVRHFEVEDYPLDRNTYHIFSHEHIEVIGNIYENPDLIS